MKLPTFTLFATFRARIRFSLAVAIIATLSLAQPAKADPITVAIFGTAFAASAAGAVATFVITAAITYGLSLLTNALFGPKQRQQERQASVLALNIGEVSREAIFGDVSTGGSLIDRA